MPTNYFVFLQAGFWDLEILGTLWTKRVTAVLCCDCSNTCYKWAVWHVAGHAAGRLELRASQMLPPGNWCNSGAPYCQ